MNTLYFTAPLAAISVAVALPVRIEVLASAFCVAGVAALFIHDYVRSPRRISLPRRARVLRARAQFRPLPLSIPTQSQGVEIRPIVHRLREGRPLAA
jgi:hypothetical protein